MRKHREFSTSKAVKKWVPPYFFSIKQFRSLMQNLLWKRK